MLIFFLLLLFPVVLQCNKCYLCS